MARNVHRLGETLGRAVQDAALKVGLGSKSDRMDQDVEPAPFRPDLIEHRLELPGDGDVDRTGDRSLDRPEGFRAAVGDRLVVRHAEDERLLSGENWAKGFLAHAAPPSTNRSGRGL